MIKYLNVTAYMPADGKIKPNSILWEDGRSYEIDKILDIQRLASTKGGGPGIRFLCMIKGQRKSIFLKGYKWFIELDTYEKS